MEQYQKRKSQTLASTSFPIPDKSPKGFFDTPMAPLIDAINRHSSFFTTGSCPGRISVLSHPIPNHNPSSTKNKKKAGGGGWVFVTHEPADPEEVVESVFGRSHENGDWGLLVFRFEPLIISVECLHVEAAKMMVAAAVSCGFRESGITGIHRRVIVAIRCSIRLEVPLGQVGSIMVSQAYVRYLVGIANEKMEANRKMTDGLLHVIQSKVHMTFENVLIVCQYNGTLSIGSCGRPNYIGGKSKMMRIPKTSTFANLKTKIYSTTRINPNEYEIKVVCRVPTTTHDFTSVEVVDDKDTEVVLSLYPENLSVNLLVVQEVIVRNETSLPPPQGGFSRMLDVDNDSTGFITPQAPQYETTSVTTNHPMYESYTPDDTDDIDSGVVQRHAFKHVDAHIRPLATYSRRSRGRGAGGLSQSTAQQWVVSGSSQSATQSEDILGTSQSDTQLEDVPRSSHPVTQPEETPHVPRQPRSTRKRIHRVFRCPK